MFSLIENIPVYTKIVHIAITTISPYSQYSFSPTSQCFSFSALKLLEGISKAITIVLYHNSEL